MTKSKREPSTSEKIQLPKSKKDWITSLESISEVHERFGSFLPSQLDLLKKIYDFLSYFDKPIVTFTAPPASGKTHVITLLGNYLNSIRKATCIVVPNGELKNDFREQETKIKSTNNLPPIFSLAEYVRVRSKFDIALIDEAHNLQNAYDLDLNLTKSFNFKKNENYFYAITKRFLYNKEYAITPLQLESAKDVLDSLIAIPKFSSSANIIKKSLSNWIGYLIATKKECKIKFMNIDPNKRSILPKELLILFSATPLEKNELSFYCNVPLNKICDNISITGEKNNSDTQFFALKKEPELNEKFQIVDYILKRTKNKSLILLNNNEASKKWFSKLKKSKIRKRIHPIASGQTLEVRSEKYRRFNKTTNGVIITSSSVFWEGITIKNLELLIIPNMPFPEPNILDVYFGRTLSWKKIVERRMIQGLGRIGRNPSDKGVGVVLFPYKQLKNIKNISLDDLKKLNKLK